MRHRILTLSKTALLALVMAVVGATDAFAQPTTYLPWQAGATQSVIQGNHGGYSHATPYTRYGWDFGAPYGTSVLAAAPGRVRIASSGYNGGWGNTIQVCYADGTCSRYGHLASIAVSVGQSVGQAQYLGRVGSSGNSSGPHLHYQLENTGGISLPSSFAEAGVPRSGARVTSRNQPGSGGTYKSELTAQFPMSTGGVVSVAQNDGPKVQIGFNVRNNGTRDWGDVRLVLVNGPPENLRRAAGWETTTQIAGNQQRVPPGQGSNFRFHVNPDESTTPGDYSFQFRLYDRATGEWIPGANPSFVLRVAKACYAAKFVEQRIPPLTEPGSSEPFSIRLRNTGSCTWRREEVRLGTKGDQPFPYADAGWGSNRNRVSMEESAVPPDGTATFRGQIAPSSQVVANRLKQYLAPVAEGKQWFSQSLGIYLPIYIGNAAHLPFSSEDYVAQWVTQTYADEELGYGETATVKVTYRNAGTAVLFRSGEHPVTLRGSSPTDRHSGFIDPDGASVVGTNQGVKMDQDRVPPGEEFTFTLPIKVRDGLNPGRYQEYFRPVAEGLTWFGPNDVFWPFTVAKPPPEENSGRTPSDPKSSPEDSGSESPQEESASDLDPEQPEVLDPPTDKETAQSISPDSSEDSPAPSRQPGS